MTIAVERAAETFEEVANDLNLDMDEVKEDSIKLLKVGDLCLLHQVKGKLGLQGYKYCRVDSIVASRDNKVCTVVVKYYNYPSKKVKFATVDVRSLSLIPNLN